MSQEWALPGQACQMIFDTNDCIHEAYLYGQGALRDRDPNNDGALRSPFQHFQARALWLVGESTLEFYGMASEHI